MDWVFVLGLYLPWHAFEGFEMDYSLILEFFLLFIFLCVFTHGYPGWHYKLFMSGDKPRV